MKSVLAAAMVAVCLLAGGALAAPGDPFGGDDTGCVPDTADHLRCSKTVAKAFGKLFRSVATCHGRQAGDAFHGNFFGDGDAVGGAAETVPATAVSVSLKACETAAKGKFDEVITHVTPICSPAVLAGASAFESVLLAPATATPMSLDAQNGNVYCDGTVAIDGTGEDAGKIPLSADGLKCAEKVAKNLSKLAGAVLKCHYKAANAAFRKKHFDDEACEMAALGKYDATATRLVPSCPACLNAAAQAALAHSPTTGVEAQFDGANSLVYPCPSTTTTTTSSTTTTSTSAMTTTTISTCSLTLTNTVLTASVDDELASTAAGNLIADSGAVDSDGDTLQVGSVTFDAATSSAGNTAVITVQSGHEIIDVYAGTVPDAAHLLGALDVNLSTGAYVYTNGAGAEGLPVGNSTIEFAFMLNDGNPACTANGSLDVVVTGDDDSVSP